MPRWAFFVVAAIVAAFGAPARAAQPVALVTELSGEGTVRTRPQSSPLEMLQDLAPGTSVTLRGGARATIVHTASGVVYELAGPGTYRVQAKSIEAADARAKLARRELPPEFRTYRLDPAVAAQASIVLRGADTARLEGPEGGVLDRDELRYRVAGDLRQVHLDVSDASGTPVVQLEAAGDAIDVSRLYGWIPGRRYRVQVSGQDRAGRKKTLEAHFVLLAPDTSARLRAQQPLRGAGVTDWIVYALALESVGAQGSARPIWQSLGSGRADIR